MPSLHPAAPPLLFVVIWSTGFIVARGIASYADPNVFLAVRFLLCTIIFSIVALYLRLAWPANSTLWKLAGMGGLIQGVYLGAGFWAVGEGLQPGVMALMGTLQPPLTAAVASRLFDEHMSASGWFGLALGILGVGLAVWPDGSGIPLPPVVVLAGLISVLAITAGTLLQKTAVVSVHIVMSSAIQNAGATVTVLCLAVMLGESVFIVTPASLGILTYAVLVLSLGGTTLLLWMVRNGSATRATSLFFLVPPLAAVLAYGFFGERLTLVQIGGFLVALIGVLLARRGAR